MTNEETVKQFYTKIGALEEQNRGLAVQGQRAKSTLEGLEAQRQKVLPLLAAGDATASKQLDSLDAQGKDAQRQIDGIKLLTDQNDAAIADLHAQAAPIEAQVQAEQFRKNAVEATAYMDECADELEKGLELCANKLAEFMAHSTAIYTICKNGPGGGEYLNRVNARAEHLNQFVNLKLTNGVWKSPPPIHREAYAPRVLQILPAISPETVAA